ncbi:transglutaminase domain-containing protein [Ruminiclostridium herbifermentans]|uniref:Transglutaminase domain-containing protein n=1 Tax=Ruminiclostridium herbifermentans TaxID=2488810 RepID=A0A7H1VIU2_9FIRM|nr:transglutaminase-like domain-containing protein [Ruminiclostridium herbifermentans]QNU65304.1 transglutaminase domain-containing protein [Ruminiclostridium herbifermentans]
MKRSLQSSYDIGNKLLYLICILPICLFVIAFSLSLPINDKRIEFPWLDSKLDFAISYFVDNERSDFEYFSFKATGFGKKGRLGGNIKLSKTHVMNVKSESSKLYLKASSKAFYNGYSWYDNDNQLTQLGVSNNNYSMQINQDAEEFINGIYIETGMNQNDKIFKPSKAEIEFVNLKTKSIFAPLKVNNINFRNFQTLFVDNEQIISSSGKQQKGFSYSLEYNNLILNSDEFKNILRRSEKGYYRKLLNSYIKDDLANSALEILKQNKPLYIDMESFPIDNKIVSESNLVTNRIDWEPVNISKKRILETKELSDLIIKADEIYKRYTQIPYFIPQRVSQLAHDLTKDFDNNYDKAKAIETYLSSTYKYTLSPGNIPRDRDFVDYFLFEGKKGYCTYYASAMAIMLRCIGIPARYVEGYVMPPLATNGVYKVTNEQAHAWVEVYFEGFGWIPFEPTASYVSRMYYDTTITSQSYDDTMRNSGYSSYLEYLEMMERNKNNSNISYDNSESNTVVDNTTNNVLFVLIIIAIVIGIILLTFISLVSLNTIKSYLKIRRIKKAEPNTAVLLAYNYILKILKTQNISYYPGETPNQFGLRVEKRLDFKGYSYNKTDFIKISSHYVAARYSKTLLTIHEQEAMLEFISTLLSITYERMGKLKYIITRYVLGKL